MDWGIMEMDEEWWRKKENPRLGEGMEVFVVWCCV